MFRTKVVENTKHTFHVQVNFPFENPAVYENVENYSRAGKATDDNIALRAGCLRLETYPQNM
jgi:hypothetical protein